MSLILKSNDGRILPHISDPCHSNTVPHLNTLHRTRSLQPEVQQHVRQPFLSPAVWHPLLAQILRDLPTNMNICKDSYIISAYYNQCGLILLSAVLLASISQHFSQTRTTVSVRPTTHLGHTYFIAPISGSFAQKLPPPPPWKGTLYRTMWCPGQLNPCSDSLQAGQSGVQTPVRKRSSIPTQTAPTGPSSFLYNRWVGGVGAR
jgi:hypothetical protein